MKVSLGGSLGRERVRARVWESKTLDMRALHHLWVQKVQMNLIKVVKVRGFRSLKETKKCVIALYYVHGSLPSFQSIGAKRQKQLLRWLSTSHQISRKIFSRSFKILTPRVYSGKWDFARLAHLKLDFCLKLVVTHAPITHSMSMSMNDKTNFAIMKQIYLIRYTVCFVYKND